MKWSWVRHHGLYLVTGIVIVLGLMAGLEASQRFSAARAPYIPVAQRTALNDRADQNLADLVQRSNVAKKGDKLACLPCDDPEHEPLQAADDLPPVYNSRYQSSSR